MPRQRLYGSNAERQAAYRARLAERQRLAGTGDVTARVGQLERTLADAERRALAAEVRASHAERQLSAHVGNEPHGRNRIPASPRTRPAASAGDERRQLLEALQRVEVLEAVVADLRRRLAEPAAPTPIPTSPAAVMNRAARRRAQRKGR